MQLYNTLERATVPFTPSDPDRVTVYLCGPTVQSAPHLGHGRSAVVFDVLCRYLRWVGYEVDFVRNITDIDDKIISRAKELGITPKQVAAQAAEEFSIAFDKLGNLPPSSEPKATDHIEEMIQMIAALIDSNHAYESDGDVYFVVRSFPEYGKLSRQNVSDLRSGERVEIDDRKHDPLDFALWKAGKPGEPSWESPWGAGRPGWHIECSVMAREYLGDGFDIHCGGTDLIFPHHENEIAQSEAATGKTFARYWMHNGMLNLSGEKMAKSTGHVVTLQGALDEWDPVAVRLFYLRTHYRKPLDYSEAALGDAEASLGRLRTFRRRVVDPIEASPRRDVLDRFKTAMDDDLDVAAALAVLFDAVREGNSALDSGQDVDSLAAAFDEMMAVLGLTVPETLDADDGSVAEFATTFGIDSGGMDDLLELRDRARHEKDWARADAIRDGLAALGITIEDTADGARWHRN
ncbi:MAG: cysteine--tRNA ligase [Actinobacteria bacterium]|nr:MAG: cysteine--tRNA ligase [Actinomycetota bacterium]